MSNGSMSSSSSVGSTGAGHTVNWVLHYSNTSGAPADVKITDPLGANQTFVPGSLQTPPGFAPEWSTNGGSSYSTTEPSSGVNAVGATGTSVGGSTGASTVLGAPAASAIPTASGDGWEPIFIGGNVYNVIHDGTPTPLDCHSLATGAECPGYPTYAATVAGTPLGTGTKSVYSEYTENAAVVGTRIYYPAAGGFPGNFGVACADVAAMTSCGYTPLGLGAAVEGGSGGALIDGKYYLLDKRGYIDCLDTSTQQVCANTPIKTADPGFTQTNPTAVPSLQAWDNRYLFGNLPHTNNTRDLLCVDLANNGANCPGFPKVNYTSGVTANTNGVLVPILDPGGAVTGICGEAGTGTNHPFDCFDLQGDAVATPFSTTQTTGTTVNYSGRGSIGVVGSRIYFAETTPGAAAGQGVATYTCWDYATSSACQGFVPGSTGATTRAYTVRNQPGTDCMWELGDAGVFEKFSATFGGTSCNEANAQLSLTPSQYYCDGQSGHVTGWKQISLAGIASSDYDAAAVTITDANGNVVPGWQNKVIPNTQQSIDISSIQYSGSMTTLHVQVVVSWGSHAVKPVTVTATFTGDAPELCFKTTVGPTKCSVAQSISNDANAVTSGSAVSDAPGGDESGAATFVEAPDPTTANCKADLSISKRVSSSSVPPGGQVMFTLVVRNHGPDAATDAKVSDAIPAGLAISSVKPSQGTCSVSGSIECSLGTLASGGAAQVLVTANVASSASGSIQNCANVSGFQTDPNAGNNSSCATVSVAPPSPAQPSSDVRIVKQVNLHSTYLGRELTYTLTITNLGPAAAASVNVTDTASLGLKVLKVKATQGSCHTGPPITCALGTLAAGQSVKVTVLGEAKQSGTEVNTASVTSASADLDPGNNLSSARTTLSPALKLSKIASARTASAGQSVSYRIKVTNPSAITIAGVKVCDRLPTKLLYTGSSPRARFSRGSYCWSVGKLGSGRSKTFSLTVNVAPGRGGRSVNHATASARGVRGASATAAVRVNAAAPVPCGIASAASVRRGIRLHPVARIAC